MCDNVLSWESSIGDAKKREIPLPSHIYSTAQHDILILLKASIIFRSSKHVEGPAKQQVCRNNNNNRKYAAIHNFLEIYFTSKTQLAKHT